MNPKSQMLLVAGLGVGAAVLYFAFKDKKAERTPAKCPACPPCAQPQAPASPSLPTRVFVPPELKTMSAQPQLVKMTIPQNCAPTGPFGTRPAGCPGSTVSTVA